MILNFFMFRNYYSDTACLCLLHIFWGGYWFVNSFLFFKASTSSQWYCQYFPQFLIWLLSLFKMFLIEIFIFFVSQIDHFFSFMVSASELCSGCLLPRQDYLYDHQCFGSILYSHYFHRSLLSVLHGGYKSIVWKKSLPLWSFSLVDSRP